jgi:hypothetical protein
MYKTVISSPIGNLIAVASESHLLMLEFADSKELEKKIQNSASVIAIEAKQSSVSGTPGSPSTLLIRDDETSDILTRTKLELSEYFS